jgi:hypothetical protein
MIVDRRLICLLKIILASRGNEVTALHQRAGRGRAVNVGTVPLPAPDYIRGFGRSPWLLAVIIAALPCQGCAVDYTDPDGSRHVIGLVDLTIHRSYDPATFAGEVVDVTSAGVSIGRTPQGGFVTLGYSREVTAALRNNVLVLGNPTALLNSSSP